MASSVRVYVRVRPFNKREMALGNLRYPIKLVGNDVVIEERNKSYQFDHCFDGKAQQDKVFDIVGKKVCSDFLRGFNATQFVYGQTGSGKTWTMMGNEDNRGIIPRSSALIFEEIAARPDGWTFVIEGSYLEIYMEKVNDLLDPEKVNLNIKEDKRLGVYVEHLTKEYIASLEEVYALLKRGDKVRKVAATAMNAGSSRSHSVLTISLQQTNPDGIKTTSRLNLVDLAGSERLDKTGAQGLTQKQGALINLSLTTLSQVIAGLSKIQEGGKAVIPFRGSKLTRLLQTSLSGNSKTGLSIHLSPHEDNLDESIGTCEFGKRAKMIKTKAKAVVEKSAAQLEKEIEQLKKQIAKLKKFLKSLEGGEEVVFKEEDRSKSNKSESSAGKASAGGRQASSISNSGGAGGDNANANGDGNNGDNKQGQEGEEGDEHGEEEEGEEGQEKVSFEEYDEEQEKVGDLEQDNQLLTEENENLVAEVASLEQQFKDEVERESSLQADYKAKEDEIKKLEKSLKQMEAEYAKEDKQDVKPVDKNKHSQEVDELTKIVNEQRERLNRERDENRALKKENTELSDELTEKTRRLALAELQVMRYDTAARNKNKNSKIKVKITPQRHKPGQAWQDILEDDNNDDNEGIMTARAAGVDLEAKREGTILEKFGNLNPIPPEELKGGRSGYIYERLYKKNEFAKRYFVVQDSFLLCYDDDMSSPCQPRYVIPLIDSKVGACPKQGDKEHCMMVLCGQYFNVLATSSESEKAVWLEDMTQARFATHETLTELAFFNQRAISAIAEDDQEKIAGLVNQAAYHPMGASDYALSAPITGGMEGFLHSTGFSLLDEDDDKVQKKWAPLYCVVKDSYLLAYDYVNHSELMTEPVGIMHLGGKAEVIKQHVEGDEEGDEGEGDGEGDGGEAKAKKCYFCVMNTTNNSESITFYCSSEDLRDRWIRALNMAALITIKNVMIASIHKETISIKANIPVTPEKDMLGRYLDPLCEQPYDQKSRPLYRHPDGRTLNKDMEPVEMQQERLNKDRKPLDFYNRPLPDGAKMMFAADPVEPVGVGIDGKHYAYPSGRELSLEDDHFDAQGNKLDAAVVKAADDIVPRLKVAAIVRSATLRKEKHDVFDAFGRVVRRSREGMWVNAEGQPLPVTAPLFDVIGNRIQAPANQGLGDMQALAIHYVTNENTEHKLGSVEIEVHHTTLLELHAEIKKHSKKLTDAKISRLTFLDNGQPIPDKEREVRLASSLLPRTVVVCKDIQGKSVVFNSGEFNVRMHHEAVDRILAKDKEAEFLKQVGMQKRKRTMQQ